MACPKCGKRQRFRVNQTVVSCRKCKTEYRVDLPPDYMVNATSPQSSRKKTSNFDVTKLALVFIVLVLISIIVVKF
jgi:ribosomal protein L37AE/L43A